MTEFNEAYRSMEQAIDSVIASAEGVPAHIKADVLLRRANEQKKIGERLQTEAAGSAIERGGADRGEAEAKSTSDAAPTDQGGKPQDPKPAGAQTGSDAAKTAPGAQSKA